MELTNFAPLYVWEEPPTWETLFPKCKTEQCSVIGETSVDMRGIRLFHEFKDKTIRSSPEATLFIPHWLLEYKQRSTMITDWSCRIHEMHEDPKGYLQRALEQEAP
jgi:hypothetical protein